MEVPSARTRDHLGAHKESGALLEKLASKTGVPVKTLADFSQEKHEKQVDSLLEKQDKHAEDHVLPGNQALQMHGVESHLEKQTSVLGFTEVSTEKRGPDFISTESMLSSEKTGGVVAAASNGCEPYPSDIERAEIDTVVPFESIKEAVTFFGERMEQKPQLQVLDHERKTASGVDAQKAYEEVGYYQELLSKEEASIAETLLELEKIKEQIQVFKGKVPFSLGDGEVNPPSNQPEEVLNVGMPQELYVSIIHELEMARKEIENVHEERTLLESLKQIALKEREAAFSSLEAASIRIKDLMTEQASSQEALAAAKAALAELESESDASRLTSSVEPDGKSMSNVGGLLPISDMKVTTLKSLELNLSEADTLIEKLKEELATIRDVKARASSSVSNSEGKLTTVKLRLEQAKAAEGDRVAAIGRILEELDVAKINLSKVTQDGASLASAVGGLQAEVAKCQAELESARETEQIACATLASLQDELCSIRALVLSAHAAEVNAREAKRNYPTEIKQLASEADAAKAASKLVNEEARKGTLALEQAKAAMNTAVSRLQAAQKEAEAARAAEAMAIAEFTALSGSKGDLVDSKEGSEAGKEAVSISLEEYRALNDAGREAEGAANEKVAAALVQVEAAKASQSDTQAKLDAAMHELEMLQKTMGEVQTKADDAHTAKLSVEADLRKWRAEHEQRRRTSSNPSSVSTSAAQSPRLNAKVSSQGKVIPHSFRGKPAAIGLDSLAEVLSLKLPPAEKTIQKLPEVLKKPENAEKVSAEVLSLTLPPAEKTVQTLLEIDALKKPEKAKKVSFFSRVMLMLVRKKSKSGRKINNTQKPTMSPSFKSMP